MMVDVIKLLQDMVAIPSMNPMGSGNSSSAYTEGAVADFLAAKLSSVGIDCESYEVMPGRKNLIGHLDMKAGKTVMLEAHLDTVPADNMNIEPFGALSYNGRVYGRGSCDAKASLAAFFGTVMNIAARNTAMKFNITLLAACDEEHGFSGARAAARSGLKVDFAVVGEPTRLRIVRSHKGVVRWRVRATGKAAHSAYPELGRNAIYTMSKAVSRIAGYAEELRNKVPHEFLGAPSLSVGIIKGGHTVNIVPDNCWIEIDRRVIPGENLSSIIDPVKSLLSDIPDVEFEEPYLTAPAVDVDADSEVIRLLSSAASQVMGDVIVEGAHYATDAGIFNDAGVPAIVFGPGNIANAHTAGEFVEISDVLTASKIIETFLLS